MKTLSLKAFSIALVLSFTLTSCTDGLFDELMNRKGLAKKFRVQEMIHQGRHYQIVYDNKGFVDYIEVFNEEPMYTYDVTYERKQLYAAELIEDGEVVSKHHNFQFDESGNIIGFTYTSYFFGVPGGIHQVYELVYDDQNRLISVSRDGSSDINALMYDDQDNIVRWITDNSEVTYTYDDKLNPLYMIPDLFVLFVEEAFFWEFVLSKHNMATRTELTTRDMQVQETTYINTYDEYNRLVSKTDEEGNGFTFIYEPLKGNK